MPEFRYAQFCALARAAEVVGERWTLLIVRDLTLGPLRFSDLRRRLNTVSPSVLSERLTQLEQRGLIERRVLGPPAGSTVYALTEMGRALKPAMIELTKWGVRFLLPPEPGEHLEPAWAIVGLEAFARHAPTRSCSFELRIPDGTETHVVQVHGGEQGTRVCRESGDLNSDTDVQVTLEPMELLALLSGFLKPSEALASGRIQATGNLTLLEELPRLFELDFGRTGTDPHEGHPPT